VARPDEAELTFEDDGERFDPRALAAPSPSRDVDEAKVGGLGIHLVRSLVASVRYEALRKGRNRTVVIVSTAG
jgi:serine/threonine-protein kinase RsbW